MLAVMPSAVLAVTTALPAPSAVALTITDRFAAPAPSGVSSVTMPSPSVSVQSTCVSSSMSLQAAVIVVCGCASFVVRQSVSEPVSSMRGSGCTTSPACQTRMG